MAIGLIVGGWAASAVISKLINELVECAKNQRNKLGLEEELTRLKTGLPKIKAAMNDVNLDLIREVNKPLEEWLWQLRDAADQADDVMDEMEFYVVNDKVQTKNKVSAVKTFLECAGKKNDTLLKLKNAVMAIDDVLADVDKFIMNLHNLVETQERMVIDNRQTSSVLNVGSKPYGRVEENQHIVSKLLNPVRRSEEVNFSVLPIIGAGGIGKTTLAQLVYNDSVVKNNFELRMWVCISNNFDVDLLTKKLYESAFGQRADADHSASIQSKLEEKLMSKKFLIVFDDAWNENDIIGWETFMAPLKRGKSGSMILLTTRMETVARLIGPNVMDPINLKGLNDGDMRDLLEEYAFRGKDPNKYKELVRIGSEIVWKLKGFPLAAKTVGGILCSNLSETHWMRILESDLWSLEKGPNDIMPALRLTYQHLPKHLKPCFSFCSIFPQDHIFIKDDLINMWVALGLVPRDFSGKKRPEDVGSEYFEDMLNRSIFSPANPVRNTHLQYPAYTYYSVIRKQFVGGYIMHDLMHDLSSFVSQGECFRSDRNKSIPSPPTVRHLYIRVSDCSELSSLKLKNVRTLILQFDDYNPTKLVCVLNELLKGMTSLRLLTLLSLKLSEIPESICHLLHLRYLSLSSFMIEEFPSSMSRLHYLETIVCGGFGSTNHTNVLVKLTNLRHIIASESFVHSVSGIGRLTSLQELCFHVDKKSGFIISELSNMRELRRLAISNINDISNHEEAKQANLRNKVCLRALSLQWETDGFDENVFDHLEPYPGLRALRIRNYMGRKAPIWLRPQTLSKLEVLYLESVHAMHKWSLTKRADEWMQCLKELTIDDCKMLCVLPPLPVSLKKLKLAGLGLVYLPNLWEDQRRSMSSPSLVRLEINGCPNLVTLNEGLLNKPDIFVALEELIITDCGILKMLPGVFNDFSSLKRLEISGCPRTNLFDVLVSLPPSKLQLLRIGNYIEDAKSSLRNEFYLHELRSQHAPTLQIEEGELFVIDHPGQSNWELRFLGMRDYIGKWPPTWLAQGPTMLESLCIDGSHTCRDARDDTFDEFKYNVNALALLHIICAYRTGRVNYPSIRAHPSWFAQAFVAKNAFVAENAFVATHHTELMQRLKKLKVALWSASCIIPPLPLTLKELRLYKLGTKVIPNQSSVPGIFPCLVTLEIIDCPNIESLAEGMLQEPQQFAALEKITIHNCSQLMILPQGGFNKFFFPQGGFNKFISLKELDIRHCQMINAQFVEECFLPSALQSLCIRLCGDLDITVSKALESVHSLSSLSLKWCLNMSSLPPREVFSRWKTLEKLEFEGCIKLTSLESLLGLSSVRLLDIRVCPKLVSAITSPSAGKRDEIEGMVEDDTIQTSNRPASTQPTPADPSSSTNTWHKSLLYVDELEIDNPLLLYIEPIRSLSSVRKLTINTCSRIQSLPELPPIIEELSLKWCSPELKRRCEKSGEDWSKLSHIPKVSISGIHTLGCYDRTGRERKRE